MALTATTPQVIELQLKTYDDLRAIPEDGNRYELIFGEVVMSPSPKKKHQRALSRLNERMSSFVQERKLGEVFFAPFDVKFSPYSVVEPDLLYVSREKRKSLGDDFVDGAPDIVVEVLSPSNRMQDLVKKAALYAMNRVSEYWVLDPDSESITVHQWKDGQYVALKSRKGIARSIVLAGFQVSNREIFAEPDWMKTSDSEAE